MARLPRLDLPGIPQRIVQHGNHRLPCFLDDDDWRRYLHLLRKTLLATPPEAGAIARLLQQPGRNYVRPFNARDQRTGTLWEGRCKAGLVDSESRVLQCLCCIDLNPVRARMTDDPLAWPWSSGARSG